MLLKQFYLGCLSHASYFIGDESTKRAVVVDPQRDIEQYLQFAAEEGYRITNVMLTHFHADFISGQLELRDQCNATIHIGARAQAEYDFEAMPDGSVIEFGKLKIQVLETPGHTPESICILVYDLNKSAQNPHAVLTGDTLFIGDVGRPDLLASVGVTQEELAGMLYDSVTHKLLPLPDETLLYPAHGAGSMCGKNLSKDTVSTIGAQRKFNYALQPMSKSEFIKLVTADQPDAPKYFAYDAMLNRREHSTLESSLQRAHKPISVEGLLKAREAGAQILDVRDPMDYAPWHLSGSINVGLGGQFATWCGCVLERERPIIIIADPGHEEEAAMRLGRIGFDHVAGYLDGGIAALQNHPDLMRSVQRVTAEQLSKELETSKPPHVLDVRYVREWNESHIKGSINVPLNHLLERIAEVPRDGRLVIHCARGYRSAIALSLLEAQGVTNATDLIGGIAAWESAKLGVDVPVCNS
jgi:hydroxyacylglutathione hydrolase